jgi:Multiubiquitin
MQDEFAKGVEDVSAVVASGRTPRNEGPYGVLVGNDKLEFRAAVLQDPVVNGAQILAAVGITEAAEHAVFQMLDGGQLEGLRPEESTDLRSAGVERFVIFRTDRSFRILIDDRTFEWGAGRITGATLKRLAGVRVHSHDVWQVVTHGEDRVIRDREFADLTAPGVERFVIKPVVVRIIVNARPREVHKRELAYWEVVKLAFPDAAPAPNTVYTINYARGPHQNPEGSMVEGQHVLIKDGMTFYVTVTDKS